MRIVTLLAETDTSLWNASLAAAIIGVLLFTGVWAFRRWWLAWLPAQQAMWEAEIKERQAREKLHTTLSEEMPKTNRLIAKMDARQEQHMATCQATDEITGDNAKVLHKISNHLGLQ